MRRVPVLWLCGPSGVGKSTVGFEVFDRLSRAGTAIAHVDLDQLRLCYPAPADDPDNHRVRARSLGEAWTGFLAAGARCLVISGLVDDADEVRRTAGRLPGADLTVCRLRVGHDELRRRIARRGSLPHLADENVRNAADLDGTDFADLVVDTSGIAAAEVAARVLASGWPGEVPERAVPAMPPTAGAAPAGNGGGDGGNGGGDGAALLLCGPPAVGKSTVGFEVFQQALGRGVPAAYVDLAQIGFCRPAPRDDPDHHRLKAHLLGRMWEGFREAGARLLVVSGNVADPGAVARYRDAVGAGGWTVCRLRARPETLTGRILLRGRGGGPGIMGDDLRGRPEAELRQRAVDIARAALALDRSGIGDVVVDTDGHDVADLAGQVSSAVYGLPGQ